MRSGEAGTTNGTNEFVQRKSLCFATSDHARVLHAGDDGFWEELRRLYSVAESNAAEQLVTLKNNLRGAAYEVFWPTLAKGVAELAGAEMSFVSKRVLVDEHDAAVEMPPIGDQGSCLMATAFYYNDNHGLVGGAKDLKYHAYGCPCAYMRHDKIFIIPERLNDFIGPANPNKLPFPGEAYMGVPLFAEGKCFAHFGVMWSAEGAAKRQLSWAYLEMMFHSLEDLILQRFLEGANFIKSAALPRHRHQVIPHEAVTAAQSLKPYARSLSHELRTPMQGVVGMLDVMYATVQEAAEGQTSMHTRKVFETLKENIEIVQDSSRRAVEAADNVVHAYDMDMSVPDSPVQLMNEDAADSVDITPAIVNTTCEDRPGVLVAGSGLPVDRPNKRRREDADGTISRVSKVRATLETWTSRSDSSKESKTDAPEVDSMSSDGNSLAAVHQSEVEASNDDERTSPTPSLGRGIIPGLRHTNIRNIIQYVVNEGLKVGGRPESAIAYETDLGETIEVRKSNPSGATKTTIIDWSVEPDVPETMFIDEKDLGKLISCVFLNAIKFTEEGHITVTACMSPKSRYVVVSVVDTGPGIPVAFLPSLFKPFAREDVSLTRQSEGLGLGLMVAKGISRKIGGDLVCVRAETSGPNRGCEFEMRVPVVAGEVTSRPTSPFGSPTPQRRTRLSTNPREDSSRTKPSSPPLSRKTLSRTTTSPSPRPLTSLPTHRRTPTPPPQPPQTPSLAISKPSPPTPNRRPTDGTRRLSSHRKRPANNEIDRDLALKHPLTFLVAEDNKINRKLLVSMLGKFGYQTVFEAYDGAEAVRQMSENLAGDGTAAGIDVVLMDLWMPFMDGYEAAEKILSMSRGGSGKEGGSGSGSGNGKGCGKGGRREVTVLAVTADVTDGALERAAQVGMKGFLTKPYKMLDLQRLILEYCSRSEVEAG
ncbi:hypothetical protein LTR50_005567 [Elasticomyces elasticus]|nr:hypothetical protein LTR50_005567 [Elasticomyces elasticus]